MTDIFQTARDCITPGLIESYFSCEKSYWKNGEFWTLNPLRADNNVGSFSISEQGYYCDNAFKGQYEGDFIKLISEVYNISLKEAAEQIVEQSGGVVQGPRSKVQEKTKKEKKPKIGIKITRAKVEQKRSEILAQFKSKYVTDCGWTPKTTYKYEDYNSTDVLFYLVRYEKPNIETGEINKKFCPFHMNEKEEIRIGLPTNMGKFPLYNINSTIDNELPVLLVEGEKAANVKVDGYNLVTFVNGTNNLDKSEFKHLKKKTVYIWPDLDEPGITAARQIKEKYLKNAIILNLDVLEGKEKGYDIADAEKDESNIIELIEQMKPTVETEDIIFDPEFAADLFLDKRYNKHNLDKIDSIHWQYLEKKHYWQRLDFSNIKSDIQIFLKEKGFFQYAQSIDKSKKSFKNGVIDFIQDYSQGYFKNNPFKESAIAPYVNLKDGMIKITDSDFEFISREDKDEDFFRKLYPVNCFDFEYNEKNAEVANYNNICKYAPTFYYYVKSIIPKSVMSDFEMGATMKFIFQMIAYCIAPMKKRPYFFSFYGDEDTAKSSLFYLIREFIGEDFTVSRSVADMENSRFSTSDLWGAKLFVDEDMQENSMLPAAFIKKYSGTQSITIERKNENAQHGVKISVAMFFVSNYKLKAYGIEGLKRRAIIAKFENKVPKNPDTDLMSRISGKKPHNELTPDRAGETFDERSFLIHLIMQEWKEMAKNGHKIMLPEWIKKSTNDLLSEMTSSNEYIKEAASGYRENIHPGIIYNIDEIFTDYKEWCSDQGRKPKGKNKFEEEIKRDDDRIEKARKSNKRKGVYKILEYDFEESESGEMFGNDGEKEDIPF
jgi:phage/plasmid-associated DNA primase